MLMQGNEIDIADKSEAFDWAFAIWYWLSHNHEGQGSKKYSVMSMFCEEHSITNIPDIDFESNDSDENEMAVMNYEEITEENWESVVKDFENYMENYWDKDNY